MSDKEIYFHVGLGKTGSTYLQTRLFPKLRGIRYIPPQHYRASKRIIRSSTHTKFLVSREFDRQLLRELDWFLSDFPETRIIIVFRRHDEWIASHYRRYVKNGWSGRFDQFIDLQQDSGLWKLKELTFGVMIDGIKKRASKSLMLIHDDLENRHDAFFQQIRKFTGTTLHKEKVSLSKVHTSFSDKQLITLRKVCRIFGLPQARQYNDRFKNWLFFRPLWFLYHLILYGSALLPAGKEKLIDPIYLNIIREHFKKDWEKVVERSGL